MYAIVPYRDHITLVWFLSVVQCSQFVELWSDAICFRAVNRSHWHMTNMQAVPRVNWRELPHKIEAS